MYVRFVRFVDYKSEREFIKTSHLCLSRINFFVYPGDTVSVWTNIYNQKYIFAYETPLCIPTQQTKILLHPSQSLSAASPIRKKNNMPIQNNLNEYSIYKFNYIIFFISICFKYKLGSAALYFVYRYTYDCI